MYVSFLGVQKRTENQRKVSEKTLLNLESFVPFVNQVKYDSSFADSTSLLIIYFHSVIYTIYNTPWQLEGIYTRMTNEYGNNLNL